MIKHRLRQFMFIVQMKYAKNFCRCSIWNKFEFFKVICIINYIRDLIAEDAHRIF